MKIYLPQQVSGGRLIQLIGELGQGNDASDPIRMSFDEVRRITPAGLARKSHREKTLGVANS